MNTRSVATSAALHLFLLAACLMQARAAEPFPGEAVAQDQLPPSEPAPESGGNPTEPEVPPSDSTASDSYSGTDDHNFELANRPLVRAGAGSEEIPNILDTGKFFTADPVQLFNAELAMVLDRFSMSAEYQLGRAISLFDHFNAGVFAGPFPSSPPLQSLHRVGQPIRLQAARRDATLMVTLLPGRLYPWRGRSGIDGVVSPLRLPLGRGSSCVHFASR